MNFEFATAGRIVFGAGKRALLPDVLKEVRAERVFLVVGSPERHQETIDALQSAGLTIETFSVRREPELATIREGMAHLREFQPQAIVAIGGGAVMDAGKAFAGLEANEGDPLDYLEIIGAGKPLANAVRLPMIALPTTAGTGSEVTRNAVTASPENRLKVSLRHRSMLPAVAIVDPELTLSSPQTVTAYSGMDALVQLIEPFVSVAATPITDGFCREGLRVGASAMPVVYGQPDDMDARTRMAFASLCGGLALANAKLGAVHGFAGVIGGMFDAPHGAICARLLPPVIDVNLDALTARGGSKALDRYAEIARMITGSDDSRSLVTWAQTCNESFAIPPLSSYGVTSADLPTISEKSADASSMKGNPIVLTPQERLAILERAL